MNEVKRELSHILQVIKNFIFIVCINQYRFTRALIIYAFKFDQNSSKLFMSTI